MAYHQAGNDADRFEPLLSGRLAWRIAAIMLVLALLSALAGLAGRWLGERIVFAGHSASTVSFHSAIGADDFLLPANVVRFESQRREGPKEALDLYFRWPEMEGFSAGTSAVFNRTDGSASLLFVSLSRRIMSKDMSGRYAPMYSQLIEGAALPGPAGLVAYDLTHAAGYEGERLYVARDDGEMPYVVRCLDESEAAAFGLTTTACQRDILIGEDTAALYRFPAALLPDWRAIEQAVRGYLEAALR